MTRIFKYYLVDDEIPAPGAFRILHAGLDPNEDPCIWAMVQPNEHRSDNKIRYGIFGTGSEIDTMPYGLDGYVSTFRDGIFVWHVFARIVTPGEVVGL